MRSTWGKSNDNTDISVAILGKGFSRVTNKLNKTSWESQLVGGWPVGLCTRRGGVEFGPPKKNPFSGREEDLNQGPPYYKSSALPLGHSRLPKKSLKSSQLKVWKIDILTALTRHILCEKFNDNQCKNKDRQTTKCLCQKYAVSSQWQPVSIFIMPCRQNSIFRQKLLKYHISACSDLSW